MAVQNNKNDLEKIWRQVPPDYYQTGIKSNLLQRFWHSQKLKTLKLILGKKKFGTILDVGCASGSMTNEISKLFPKSKIIGIDVYSSAVEHGNKLYPHIKFIVADAHKLPFAKNSFDLVICYETIEHVINPIGILSQMHKVVKNNGLVIVEMDSGSLPFRIIWWIWEKTKGRVWQNAHLHPFHHTELQKTIEKIGFRVVKRELSHFGMAVTFALKK